MSFFSNFKYTYYKIKKFYKSISNRSLAILVLLIFAMYGYYLYEKTFVYDLLNLEIFSNVDGYSIEIYNKTTFSRNNYECENNYCEINNLSKFVYEIKIKKDGYDDLIKEIDLSKNNKLYIDIIKINNLSKIENDKEENIGKGSLNSIKNDFVFKVNNQVLDIYYRSYKIGSFNYIEGDKYDVFSIIGDENNVYLQIGENNYIFSLNYYTFKKFDFKFDILYIKKHKNLIYQFISSKGIFIYDFNKNNFTYFDMFFDFVLNNGTYIGYVSSEDKRRKLNLGFENIAGNLLVSFDKNTKKKSLIKVLDKALLQLYIKDNLVYTLFDDYSLYVLE